jgi:hypothetical protein
VGSVVLLGRKLDRDSCPCCLIFGSKRDEVAGEWRNLHSEELHILYSSPDITRQIRSYGELGGQDMWHAWERKAYRVLVGRA